MAQTIRVGDWVVRPDLDVIERNGERRKLEPRVMRVLLFLLARRGDVVSRQELLESVWPDVTVGEEALTQAISAIRKAFEDDAREPRFIRTIPKRGYQLIAESAAAHTTARPRYRTAAFVAAALLTATLGIALSVPRGAIRQERPELSNSTAYPGRETDPALSADGSLLAFAWNGTRPDVWSVYVQPREGLKPRKLSSSPFPESSPSFSPSADRIAFIRHGEECEVIVRDLGSGVERQAARCGNSGSPRLAWSPRDELLVLSDAQKATGELELFLIDLKTGDRRALTTALGIMGDRYPSFSPDGKEIAFVRTRAMGASDLLVVSSAGGSPRQLTFEGRWIQGVTWIEKDRLIFSSARSGRFELWILNLKNSAISWFGIGARPSVSPAASRTGSLVFEQQNFDSDIYLLRESGREAIARSTLWEDEPRWSPDGNQLAFVSERSGSRELWVSERSGGTAAQLTHFLNTTVRSPRWSPDGRSIAFASSDGKSSSIWKVDLDARRPVRLTSGGKTDVSPAWSRDGTRIYFSSDRDGAWGIWSVSPSGGEAEKLADITASTIFEAADGSLYINRPDVGGIWRLPRDGGPEVVVQDFRERDFANWELVDNSLWYLDRDRRCLVALDLESGIERKGPMLPMSQDDIGISVNRRGEVLFAAGARTESDLIAVTAMNGAD